MVIRKLQIFCTKFCDSYHFCPKMICPIKRLVRKTMPRLSNYNLDSKVSSIINSKVYELCSKLLFFPNSTCSDLYKWGAAVCVTEQHYVLIFVTHLWSVYTQKKKTKKKKKKN